MLDCPPGTACSVMESVMDADYCVLVAEPTSFGFHNFKMVWELSVLLEKRAAWSSTNRSLLSRWKRFAEHDLPVLDRIPYDATLAARLANGEIAVESSPSQMERFRTLLAGSEVRHETTADFERQGRNRENHGFCALIRLAQARAVADCDVDAPNLHLLMQQSCSRVYDFIGGVKAQVDTEKCIGCGKCDQLCRFDAIHVQNDKATINEYACEGCGVCDYVCPVKAVTLVPDVAGRRELYLDENVFYGSLENGTGTSESWSQM